MEWMPSKFDEINDKKELFGLFANMSAWWTATWKRRILRPDPDTSGEQLHRLAKLGRI